MEDPILFWNHLCNEANRFDHTAPMKGTSQGGPTRSSRATAMVHLAMHDAFFGVEGSTPLYLGAGYPAYVGPNDMTAQSSSVTAAAKAVLSSLYPEQAPEFEKGASDILDRNGANATALDYGYGVAQAMLALRAADGSEKKDGPYEYALARPHHRPDPINALTQISPLGPNWGKVKPFAIQLNHGLQSFPALTTPDYRADHEEVLKKGGAASQPSTTRTIDQTIIGLYWAYDGAKRLGTPPRLYNQIVRVIAQERGNDWVKNARLFALVNAAMGDAGIYSWYYKYTLDLWRPVIGIRNYDDNFGWDAQHGTGTNALCDPFWRPFGAPKTNDNSPGARAFTPPFPAYPSGHATFGSAAFEMVRLFYNTGAYDAEAEDTIGFKFVSAELDGVSTDNDEAIRTRHARKYDSLAQAMFENAVSRVYLGVHWRFDGMDAKNVKQMLKRSTNTPSTNTDVGGVPLGRAIARDIFNSMHIQSSVVI